MIGSTVSAIAKSPSCHGELAPSGLRRRYIEHEKHDVTPSPPRRELQIALDLDTLLKSSIATGPNIKWNPSYDTFRARVEMLARLNLPRPENVPEGFPEVVDAPWVWDGSDMTDEPRYVVLLSEADILEVESALDYFKGNSSSGA